jgi:protein-tyrosine phosphatase
VIDLHSHILPGVDDGPKTVEGSLELARVAVAAGTRTILATPHINDDRSIDAARVAAGLEALRPALGGGPYLLVESPFSPAIGAFEPLVLDLLGRGHRVLLAHPERCPAFHRDPERLQRLVDAGVLVQITAGSMTGGFGSTVRRLTATMLRTGVVHVVASDAHDAVKRPPGLNDGFTSLERELPGLAELQPWMTEQVPRAILDGTPLPERPPLPKEAGFLRRLGLRA